MMNSSTTPLLTRREALRLLGVGAAAGTVGPSRLVADDGTPPATPPNVLFVFSDQQQNRTWQQNNSLIQTPRMMQLASEGTVVQNMTSQTPICTPFRGMLMSGQYPLTTGVIGNDKELVANGTRLSEVTDSLGYRNGYIGKWHLSGARADNTRPDQIVSAAYRHGFGGTWKGHEAQHNYRSGTAWYDEVDNAVGLTKYRDFQEADEVKAFLDDHAANHASDPFFAVWSMGPPHDPYNQYNPNQPSPDFAYYRALLNDPANRPPNYDPNGPVSLDSVAGYYAMCSGIDTALGEVLDKLDALNLSENTIVVYTSDHGDMLGAFRLQLKQKPWEESINVPFIIRYPGKIPAGVVSDMLLGSVDLMPTLLGLMGHSASIPAGIEGLDLSAKLCGQAGATEREHLWIGHASGFNRPGNRASPAAPYTGVRTKTHTYASFANGTVVNGYGSAGGYILHDNINDPWQQRNLVDQQESRNLQAELWDRVAALNIEAHETAFTLPTRPVTSFAPGSYLKLK
jgi:arylsulfatase A-like enzyme